MLVDIVRLKDNNRYGLGLYENKFPFNGDFDIWGRNAPFKQAYFSIEDYCNCGVCDSPEQLMDVMSKTLIEDPRPLVVMFDHVVKEPENAFKGGGWRWRKWGEYIGKGTPTAEYLDDEEAFSEGVYCYHIYDVTGIEQC